MSSPDETRVNTPTSRKSAEWALEDEDDLDDKPTATTGEADGSGSDHHDEHPDEHELAPLPDIGGARKNARTSSFSAHPGGAARQRPHVSPRPRPRAFSAGAGAGGVVTQGGTMPTTDPIDRPANGHGLSNGHAQRGLGGHFKETSGGGNGFAPLSMTASRISNVSNHTFADAASLVSVPGLSRVETRTERRARARAGTVTTLASLARTTSIFSDGRFDEKEEDEELEAGHKGDEELVAVQVVDDGEEIVYPDGGLQAWLVLFGGVCAAVCAFGLAGSVGAFQTYYQEHLLSGYTSSTISWIGSCQAAVCFSTCVFTGPLFDRYGCTKLLASGTLLLVLAFCLLSLCSQFYQIFLCHATLMAAGMNLVFLSPMAAVGQWFFLKRGLAFGILMMGSSVGAIIWPVIVANLPQKIGFAWTMRLVALLIAILGTTATVLIRTRLPPRPPGPFFHFSEFKNPAYACVAASFPCFVFGFFSYLTFIGTYGRLNGLGELAPYLLMITNGASGFGRVFAGLLADYWGTFNVSIMGQLGMVVLTFAWLGMKTPAALIALCVVYGFFSGAPVSLQGPLVTASASDPRLAGTLIGQALMVQSFAQLCGPPIFGAIVGSGSQEEQLARFPHAIAFGGCMLVCSVALVTAARFYKNREVLAIV